VIAATSPVGHRVTVTLSPRNELSFVLIVPLTRVELRGFEPLTPSMRTRCATGLRYSPWNADSVANAGHFSLFAICEARCGAGQRAVSWPVSAPG
jgi:hypothetical protein